MSASSIRTKLRVVIVLTLMVGSVYPTHAVAQKSRSCELTDLNISLEIPEGYSHIPTECPMVSYKEVLATNHALGVYVIETPVTFSVKKDELKKLVDTQVLVTQVGFDKKFKDHLLDNLRIDNEADYPPAIIEADGACGELEVKFRLPHPALDGVERRRGVICYAELPPAGSGNWTIVQAFVFEVNLDPLRVEFASDFDQIAKRLFRSVRVDN